MPVPDSNNPPEDELSRLVRELNASVGRAGPAEGTISTDAPASADRDAPDPPPARPLLPTIPNTPPPPAPATPPGQKALAEPTSAALEAPPADPPARGGAAAPPVERRGSLPLPAGESEAPIVESLRHVSEKLDGILVRAVRLKASDILLVAGFPPTARVHGSLEPLADDALTPADTRSLALLLLDEVRFKEFQRDRAVDFAFERAGGRFRCDLHHQRGSVALALRWLPRVIPSLEELNLPATIRRFTLLSRGLVLFAGPTGCGKSSSLAALVEVINRSRRCHIVTIEDPIEYRHRPGRSLVEQIEVGRDALTFPRALRHCLRQDPDVILLGELRDLETIATALTAAETGHLVFSTLHTGDAAQTVDRIIDVFPEHQQNQIRQQLAMSLAAVVAQTLIPTADGLARVPACEILIATDAIRNLIRTGKNHQIYPTIAMGRKDGMMTMEESLADLVRTGRIAREEATLHTTRTDELLKLLD
jgi:twitching motility protein PilT